MTKEPKDVSLAGMEPHELTMEELLELYNKGTLKEVMAALPFTEELVYTNLERLDHSEYALNYTYTCDLEYDGEIYPFRASYYKPEKVEGREIKANQMDMVYLNHTLPIVLNTPRKTTYRKVNYKLCLNTTTFFSAKRIAATYTMWL